ncbi:MAG: MBL fold metallo-hydrolase, partial [Proteobacteria bacterium]|nr:MBL fold metallo-hydrolase [Pseudomonadota bacterium]
MTPIEDLLDRDFDPAHGVPVQVSPLVRRVIADNPGKFTFRGTGTYVVGHGTVAVIDPGPADPAHLTALEAALDGETVTTILVTHTHRDHSPAAPQLAASTGAPVLAYGPHPLSAVEEAAAEGDGEAKVEESGDVGFTPDATLEDGAVVEGDGWTLEAVHTPGHMSNHLCFALREEAALFSGDHVMGWSTTVIPPPDGNMATYLDSLRKVRARAETTYWPTHGPPVG